MLTVDLVHARRRAGELRLVALDRPARARAEVLAGHILDAARAHVGRTREEFDAAIDGIDVEPREHRLKAGLAKLVEDRCEFDASDDIDPEALRHDVFRRASAARAALDDGAHFDRDTVLDEIARERETSREVIERALFSDLRSAHKLLAVDAPGAKTLVASYERAQAQAVLLRAVSVRVDVRCASAGALRAFFRRLKFLRLLHTIEKTDEGHRVVIDGPFSLFESVTKYGLQLALVLPALDACDAWKLEASVRWGKERTPLTFRLEGGAGVTDGEPVLPDELETLVRTFSALGTPWTVSPSAEILELPGVGLCVPDLVFERTRDGRRETVHLEAMGYWSRAAVWKRIELVQAGLAQHILFAVSSRLRVSEDVLGDDLPSALYVYKGAMNARTIAERLERLVSPREDR
ncbi:DUF790 family protein [Pendulispora brunnea]|uniref:DUF790 family protein n=1 Tax=Pendulispora brunnea TaxID=2905690 RepID=A0ABZ2JZE4_9BACT